MREEKNVLITLWKSLFRERRYWLHLKYYTNVILTENCTRVSLKYRLWYRWKKILHKHCVYILSVLDMGRCWKYSWIFMWKYLLSLFLQTFCGTKIDFFTISYPLVLYCATCDSSNPKRFGVFDYMVMQSTKTAVLCCFKSRRMKVDIRVFLILQLVLFYNDSQSCGFMWGQ